MMLKTFYVLTVCDNVTFSPTNGKTNYSYCTYLTRKSYCSIARRSIIIEPIIVGIPMYNVHCTIFVWMGHRLKVLEVVLTQ